MFAKDECNIEDSVISGGTFRYLLSMILLACFYYTIPVIKTPYGYTTYIRFDDIIGLLFVLVSLSSILNHERLGTTQFAGILIIALMLAIPSALWGFVLGHVKKNFQYGIWQTVQYTKIFLTFLSMTVIPIDVKRFRHLALIVWCGSIFVGVYGGLQYYGIISFAGWIAEFTESGPWGGGEEYFANTALGPLSNNHACIGAYMIVAIFITLFLIRTARGIAKPIYLASIPFFMIVILWSGARADFFGVFLGLAAYLIFSRVRPAAVLAMIATGTAVYIVITTIPAINARFLGTEASSDYSSGRLAGWTAQVFYLLTHPYLLLTGVGLGNFSSLRERVGLTAAHNNYLHFVSECGILGIILPFIFLKRIAVILKELGGFSKFHRELAIAFGSLIISLLGVALTQELFVPGPGLVSFPAYFAFLLGAMIGLYRNTVLQSLSYY